MFSLLRFRRTFGFFPKSVREPTRERLILTRLEQLKRMREVADSLFSRLTNALSQADTVEEAVAFSKGADRTEAMYEAARKRLEEACKLALRYEFDDPVAQVGFQDLVDKAKADRAAKEEADREIATKIG